MILKPLYLIYFFWHFNGILAKMESSFYPGQACGSESEIKTFSDPKKIDPTGGCQLLNFLNQTDVVIDQDVIAALADPLGEFSFMGIPNLQRYHLIMIQEPQGKTILQKTRPTLVKPCCRG